MPLRLTEVQRYERVPGRQEVRLTGTNPYARWVNGDNTPVVCQGGAFYSDGGERIPVKDVPPWVWEAAGKMSKQGREKIGLVLPEDEEEQNKKGKRKKAQKQEPSTDDEIQATAAQILSTLSEEPASTEE